MKAIVDAKEFAQALGKVTKVIKQSTVPVLEGVLVCIANGCCALTASDWTTWLTTAIPAEGDNVQFGGSKVFALDGYRMACDVDDSLTVRQPFMVLPEALGYLKFFGDREITANMSENYLRMTDGTTMIQTRIEGPFVFNVDGAVPKKFAEEVYISPKEFLGELDYLKKLVRSTDKANIGFSRGRLYLSAASGNYSTQVQVDGESSIGFGFDLRYMVDALRQFREEPAVKVKVNSSVAPIILEADGRGDFAMVLPVRVKAASAAA